MPFTNAATVTDHVPFACTVVVPSNVGVLLYTRMVVPAGSDEVPATVVAPAVKLPCISVVIIGLAVKQDAVTVAALLTH